MSEIEYRISPPLGNILLNRLYTAVWPDHEERDFQRVLERSVTYVGAFDEDDVLVGFVYVAWDGGAHAFLLEPMVLPEHRGRGIGTELIRQAAREAGDAGARWLHVVYRPDLERYYAAAGFRPSHAGMMPLHRTESP
ncbi:MAG TPA: GNAT family N-acetyltransferase [Gemmatimonadaceae bacterium]|nr:GNAT family N-acetyltransferase [Gemmatimonadaceae bacterium]